MDGQEVMAQPEERTGTDAGDALLEILALRHSAAGGYTYSVAEMLTDSTHERTLLDLYGIRRVGDELWLAEKHPGLRGAMWRSKWASADLRKLLLQTGRGYAPQGTGCGSGRCARGPSWCQRRHWRRYRRGTGRLLGGRGGMTCRLFGCDLPVMVKRQKAGRAALFCCREHLTRHHDRVQSYQRRTWATMVCPGCQVAFTTCDGRQTFCMHRCRDNHMRRQPEFKARRGSRYKPVQVDAGGQGAAAAVSGQPV